MDKKNKYAHDIIDEDLYEEFEDEELIELVEEARIEALKKAAERDKSKANKLPFPRWLVWIIAVAMVFHILALIPQTFSIPALEFLVTSAQLSTEDNIKTYKEAVVVIETEKSKGTGFSFNAQGDIMTNYHVVEGNETVTVAFPKLGLFTGKVVETYPDIDLAVVSIEKGTAERETFPALTLADQFQGTNGETIYFIGNPLRFNGIANEGEIIDWTYVQSKTEPVMMLRAPVYRGNSGSPVINEQGKVIGVVFATLHHKEEGRVGLFIPIDYFYAYKKERRE